MQQDVFIYGNGAWVTCKFLKDRGVPSQTIYNKTSSKKKDRWYTRTHDFNKTLKLIAYDSIPINVIEKFKLPQFSELKVIAENCRLIIKETYKKEVSRIIKDILDFDYGNWESLRSIYSNMFFDEEKIEKYCKTHILFSRIIELKGEKGFSLWELFKGYRLYDGLIFESSNYRSFCKKYNKIIKANSIEEELIHGHRNKISNNRKVTEDIIIEIQNLLANPNKYSASIITEKVNDYLVKTNRKKISQSTVERIIAQRNIKNEVAISRYGIKWVKEKMLPHAHFIAPHKEGILWGMDGTRFQFAYKGGPDDFNFLTYYIVLDGYSKKIVGYSYDDGENTKMAIEAFEQACRNTMYLPTEIISDNSPAYGVKEYVSMVVEAKRMGVNWRINKVKNPRDNHYVERCFGVIQEKYCKRYDGYIGDGIKSRNINGHPSPEEKTRILKKKNLRTRTELISLIDQIISEYNNSKDRINLMKKDEFEIKLTGKRNINPIPLDSSKYATIFWACRDIKLQNGMISFDINNQTLYYNIYDEKIIYDYHGGIVRVRYNKVDLTKVMLFEPGSNKYICTLEKFKELPKASAERDGEQNKLLYAHIAKTKELEKKLKETVKKIGQESKNNCQRVPPELAEFIPLSKPIRENSEKEIVNKELEQFSEMETLQTISPLEKEVDYLELYKNRFKLNGSLKRLDNGEN